MRNDSQFIDVFLQPGECYFGDVDTCIRTLLGSCVAITLWHPERRIGGMTHSLLPTRYGRLGGGSPDARYVDEAALWLVREAVRADADPEECVVKIFGGSDMFPQGRSAERASIGRQNVIASLQVLKEFGLAIAAGNVGGITHRSLIFEVATGDVWVRGGSAVGGADYGEGRAA